MEGRQRAVIVEHQHRPGRSAQAHSSAAASADIVQCWGNWFINRYLDARAANWSLRQLVVGSGRRHILIFRPKRDGESTYKDPGHHPARTAGAERRVVHPGSGAGGGRPPTAGLCLRAASESGKWTGGDRRAEKSVSFTGLIRPDFDPAVLAAGVARGGAAALSVLTEEPFFQGSLHNLEVASQSCNLPCLRKDFIVDEFQLLEARAHRADAILLIAAALSDLELRHLASRAHALELDVLCEVHTAEELDRVDSIWIVMLSA